MSMLKSFFEIGTDESLFDGLYISGNKELCDRIYGKVPGHFSVTQECGGSSYDDARYMITELMEGKQKNLSFWSTVRLFQKTIRTGIGLSFRMWQVNIQWMRASCIKSADSFAVIV